VKPAPLLVMGAVLVMIAKQVEPEISIEIAPDAVNVISVVLRVVVLDNELGCLYPVIVRTRLLFHSCPGEVQIVTGFLDLFHACESDLLGHVVRILLKQSLQ
jgi:hypothetical protein